MSDCSVTTEELMELVAEEFMLRGRESNGVGQEGFLGPRGQQKT